jgi:hypothetical protein
LCRKATVNSVTLCRPLLYGLHSAPLERGRRNPRRSTGVNPTPARDGAVKSDQWSASPPSSSALCGHPRHFTTIPGTTAPSPTLWEPGTMRHHQGHCCAPYGLLSAKPSSQRMDGDRTGSPILLPSKPLPNGYMTRHDARREQDSSGRPSTPRHCVPCRHM